MSKVLVKIREKALVEAPKPVTSRVTAPEAVLATKLTKLERKTQELYGTNIEFIRYKKGVAGTPWGHSGIRTTGTPFIAYSLETPQLIPDIIAHEIAHFLSTETEKAEEIGIGHGRRWYQRYVKVCKDLSVIPETFKAIQERKEKRLVKASKAEAEEIKRRIELEEAPVTNPKAEVVVKSNGVLVHNKHKNRHIKSSDILLISVMAGLVSAALPSIPTVVKFMGDTTEVSVFGYKIPYNKFLKVWLIASGVGLAYVFWRFKKR